jgi:hypothetical protein
MIVFTRFPVPKKETIEKKRKRSALQTSSRTMTRRSLTSDIGTKIQL